MAHWRRRSISDILDSKKLDPERLLTKLGFAGPDSSLLVKLPSRFLHPQDVSPKDEYSHMLESFLKKHPEFIDAERTEALAAALEVYSRLPLHFHSLQNADECTSLHYKMASNSPIVQQNMRRAMSLVQSSQQSSQKPLARAKSVAGRKKSRGSSHMTTIDEKSKHSLGARQSMASTCTSYTLSSCDVTDESSDEDLSPIRLNCRVPQLDGFGSPASPFPQEAVIDKLVADTIDKSLVPDVENNLVAIPASPVKKRNQLVSSKTVYYTLDGYDDTSNQDGYDLSADGQDNTQPSLSSSPVNSKASYNEANSDSTSTCISNVHHGLPNKIKLHRSPAAKIYEHPFQSGVTCAVSAQHLDDRMLDSTNLPSNLQYKNDKMSKADNDTETRLLDLKADNCYQDKTEMALSQDQSSGTNPLIAEDVVVPQKSITFFAESFNPTASEDSYKGAGTNSATLNGSISKNSIANGVRSISKKRLVKQSFNVTNSELPDHSVSHSNLPVGSDQHTHGSAGDSPFQHTCVYCCHLCGRQKRDIESESHPGQSNDLFDENNPSPPLSPTPSNIRVNDLVPTECIQSESDKLIDSAITNSYKPSEFPDIIADQCHSKEYMNRYITV